MIWESPSFWWQDKPRGFSRFAAASLAPVGAAYGSAVAYRMRKPGARSSLPVLCIGNFVVGGAGKTPMALALAERLIAAGENPWFLSRGYGSAAEHGAPVTVDPAKHLARDVGDEALLLARIAPTLVSADRAAAAEIAAHAGASILILDDGLQNPSLEKDLRLVVVDAAAGVGNGQCLPAGPLRAALPAQIRFASALIIVGDGARGTTLAEHALRIGRPVVRARMNIPAGAATELAGRRVYAFAGIGHPEKFFASLANVGAQIVGSIRFPDHYAYRRADITDLQRAAKARNAQPVTTEKDFVRLRPWGDFVDPASPEPMPVPVAMQISDDESLNGLIETAILHVRNNAAD
jgi:tetraacyldisaccharide 4'-kinase